MSILQQDIMAQAQGNTKTKAKANTLAKVSIVAALTLWGGGVTNPLFAEGVNIDKAIDGKDLNNEESGKYNKDTVNRGWWGAKGRQHKTR
ncbi:hypothetical protein LS77_010875 [Helicobacter bilis]|uniref:Uncharacterized protein n=1 Tax=Helicobacter bilis TaxID=37372 RepID=A0A6D2C206_9HELI|nr:hypothetical protein [Helicobacter bilis]TLE02367.1 hypothetical protein LS77_010875 [Helicobacter bilis]